MAAISPMHQHSGSFDHLFHLFGAREDHGIVSIPMRWAIRRERQLEGIAKAKAEGVYKGRPPSIDPSAVRSLKAMGLGASEKSRPLAHSRFSAGRAMSS